jgi:hypothetical protein
MAEFLPYRVHMVPGILAGQSKPISVYWEDLRFPATALRSNPVNEFPAFSTDPVGRVFRNAQTDTLYLAAQLPHAWRPGTELRPHVHWVKQTNSPMTGNVMWRLTYRWATIGEVIADAVSITSAVTTVSDGNTVNRHALTSLPPISGKGRKISDMLLMQISRLGSDAADTFGGSALLMEFDIHYQVSSPGSRQELVK